MFSNADEVLRFIKDEDVKFVDVRFCDLPGRDAALQRAGRVGGRRLLHRRPDVRRLVDPRLPGDPRVGHEADPRPRHGLRRPVPRREDARPQLLDRRPVHRRALQPRPAQHRGQGRGLPRGRPASPTPRTSGPRPSSTSSTTCASRPSRTRATTTSTPSRAPGTPGGSRRAATAATRPGTRAATSRCRRSTTTPTCATRCRSSSAPPASRSSAPTTRSAPPARPRSTTSSTPCCTPATS